MFKNGILDLNYQWHQGAGLKPFTVRWVLIGRLSVSMSGWRKGGGPNRLLWWTKESSAAIENSMLITHSV